MEWKKLKLSDISDLVSDKIDTTKFDSRNYLSTENMLPNREGYNVFDKEISEARVCAYTKGDILISNIRPYFKKIVYANVDGGCSNDVLVFRTKNNDLYDSKFLYYLLSQDLFFDYVMSGANGTKMPRGNRKQLVTFPIMLPPLPYQKKIVEILSNYDNLIENYREQIKLLERSAQRIYEEWFVNLKFPGYEKTKFVDGLPEGWERKKIGEIATVLAGGDKPKLFSEQISVDCKIPVFSNGTSNFGLYGYTNKYVIDKPAITISARGSIGYICIREEPYFP